MVCGLGGRHPVPIHFLGLHGDIVKKFRELLNAFLPAKRPVTGTKIVSLSQAVNDFKVARQPEMVAFSSKVAGNLPLKIRSPT